MNPELKKEVIAKVEALISDLEGEVKLFKSQGRTDQHCIAFTGDIFVCVRRHEDVITNWRRSTVLGMNR